jgi:hypothetical protein
MRKPIDMYSKTITVLFALSLMQASASAAAAQSLCPRSSPARWIPYDEGNPPNHRVILRTTILQDGSIVWGGARISEERLITYLRRVQQMSPAPYLVVQYGANLSCQQISYLRGIFELHARCGRSGPCSEKSLR